MNDSVLDSIHLYLQKKKSWLKGFVNNAHCAFFTNTALHKPLLQHTQNGPTYTIYICAHICQPIYYTRSLGALRAPTSSWRPFGPLDFVLRALRALRPCDPRVGDWIVCQPLDSVLAVGQCVSRWIVCQSGFFVTQESGITYSRSQDMLYHISNYREQTMSHLSSFNIQVGLCFDLKMIVRICVIIEVSPPSEMYPLFFPSSIRRGTG